MLKSKDKMTIGQKTSSLLEESKKRAALISKKRGGVSFIQSMKDELKKVTWTSKEELILCTKIVVGSIFVFGLAIYGIDVAVQGVLRGLSSALFWIIGY